MKTSEERIEELERKVADLESIIYKTNTSTQQIHNPIKIVQSDRMIYKNELANKTKNIVVKKQRIGEAVVGKYFIGALASILIFIAAISLVGLIWGSLTPEMRLGLIIGAGISLTALGFFLTSKNKNPITSLILGTGAGLLFISILAANMYFKFISSSIAILLVGLCAIFFILSYRFTKMFFTTIIAYLGSFTALILGLKLVTNNLDYIVLTLFVTSIAITIIATGEKWLNSNKQIISSLLCLLSYATLLFGGLNIGVKTILYLKVEAIFILGIIYLLLNYLYIMIDKIEMKKWYLPINIIVTCLTMHCMSVWFPSRANIVNCYFIFFVINLLQIALVEIKTKHITKTLTIYYTIIQIITIELINQELFRIPSGITIVALILLAIQILKKNKDYTAIIIGIVLIDSLFLKNLNICEFEYMSIAYSIVQIAVITYILYTSYKEKYMKSLKWLKIVGAIVYLVNSFYIPYLIANMITPDNYSTLPYSIIETVVAYFCLSIAVILILVSGFFKDWRHASFKLFSRNEDINQDESIPIFYVITFIAYSLGLAIITSTNIWYEQLTMILSVLAIALIQTGNLIQYYKYNKLAGIWIGLKYLILTWVIMVSVFDVEIESVLISVTGLIISLFSIAIGFKINIKSLRLYGLILTILMVIKFILVDLSQENSITRVVALLIGGLICFGISVLYNRLNNKINSKN